MARSRAWAAPPPKEQAAYQVLDTLGRDRLSATRLVQDARGRWVAREFRSLGPEARAFLESVFSIQESLKLPGLIRPKRLLRLDDGLVWLHRPASGRALNQSQFRVRDALRYTQGLVRLLGELHERTIYGVELVAERLFVTERGQPQLTGLVADLELWAPAGGFSALLHVELDHRVDLQSLGAALRTVLDRTIAGESPRDAAVLARLSELKLALGSREPAARPGLGAVQGVLAELGVRTSYRPKAPPDPPVASLVGRDHAIRELRALLDRALRPATGLTRRPRLIAVTGRSGIGKTRVITVLARYALEQGSELVVARARPAERRLYGVLADLAASLGVSVPLAPVAESVTLLSPAAERRRLVESLVREMLGKLRERSALFVIEDVDRLPGPAFDAISYLVRHLALEESGKARIAVVVTLRSDEDPESPSAASRGVDDLHDEGFAERLRLPLLDGDAIAELASSLSPAWPGSLPRLLERSRGNPRLAEELVRVSHERPREPLPSTLEEAFVRRLRGLPAEERRILEALAILATPVRLDVLRRLVPLSAPRVLHAALMRLCARRLVLCGSGPCFELANRDALAWIEARLSQARARHLHRLAGGAIEASGEPDSERLAYHFERGGERERFLHHGREAARRLEAAHANEQALDLYEKLLAALGLEDRSRRVELLERLAVLRGLAGDFRGAADVYEELISHTADRQKLWRYHTALGEAHRDREDYVAAAEAFDMGLRAVGAGDDLAVANLLSEKAPILARLGDVGTARGLAEMAGNLAAGLPESREVAAIRNRVGATFHRMGDHDRAVSHIEAGLRMSERVGALDLAAIALNNLSLYLASKGDLQRATEFGLRSLEFHQKLGDVEAIATTAVNVGSHFIRLSDLESAERYLELGLSSARRFGKSFVVAACLLNMAELHSLRGQYRDALDARLRALRIAERLGRRREYAAGLLALCRDLVLLRNAPEAERAARRVLQFAEERDDHRLGALAKVHLAGVQGLRGQIGEAAERLREAESTLREIGAHAELVTSLLEMAELELGRGEPGAALRHAREALQIAAERDYHSERALASLLSAEALLETDIAAAERAVREADGIAEELDQPELRWRSEALAGELALKRGDRTGAMRRFAQAREILDRIVEQIHDKDLAYSYMLDPRRLKLLRRAREGEVSAE